MNTLKIEAKLAEKYKYKNLPGDLSGKYRNYWKENIPDYLSINGDKTPLYTINAAPICKWYDRIVIGDYGAFIEFSKEAAESFALAPGQEYRVYDARFADRVKYVWLTTNDGSNVKIYEQRRRVTYADYQPGKYYVSVHEAFTLGAFESFKKPLPCQVGDILFAYEYCLDWFLCVYKVVKVTQYEDYSFEVQLRCKNTEFPVDGSEICGENSKYQLDKNKCKKIKE